MIEGVHLTISSKVSTDKVRLPCSKHALPVRGVSLGTVTMTPARAGSSCRSMPRRASCRPQRRAVAYPPQQHVVIIRAGGKYLTIRREGDDVCCGSEIVERAECLSIAHAPYGDCPIQVCRGNELPVGGKRHTGYHAEWIPPKALVTMGRCGR